MFISSVILLVPMVDNDLPHLLATENLSNALASSSCIFVEITSRGMLMRVLPVGMGQTFSYGATSLMVIFHIQSAKRPWLYYVKLRFFGC